MRCTDLHPATSGLRPRFLTFTISCGKVSSSYRAPPVYCKPYTSEPHQPQRVLRAANKLYHLCHGALHPLAATDPNHGVTMESVFAPLHTMRKLRTPILRTYHESCVGFSWGPCCIILATRNPMSTLDMSYRTFSGKPKYTDPLRIDASSDLLTRGRYRRHRGDRRQGGSDLSSNAVVDNKVSEPTFFRPPWKPSGL